MTNRDEMFTALLGLWPTLDDVSDTQISEVRQLFNTAADSVAPETLNLIERILVQHAWDEKISHCLCGYHGVDHKKHVLAWLRRSI